MMRPPTIVNLHHMKHEEDRLLVVTLKRGKATGQALLRLQDAQRFLAAIIAGLELAGKAALIHDDLRFAMHGHTKPNLKKYEEAA